MTRVLENNLRPATHFIEVLDTVHFKMKPMDIELFDYYMLESSELKLLKTIAIFKIRMKPQ